MVPFHQCNLFIRHWCYGGRKKTEGQAENKLGRWCDGRCQEVGERNWRNAANGHLAEASEEGLGSKGAVVPMMMMMMMIITDIMLP